MARPLRSKTFTFFAVLLLPLATVFAGAQNPGLAPDYTSIVVFGDSLSDTGNFADLTQAKYGVRIPGPIANYTNGRFTDGADTTPAAEKYHGVWIEQLAATFPSRPRIKDSLDGGTNYAYGFAFTGNGTTVANFGPSNEFSVRIKNIGAQIAAYLATHPRITGKTLFVLWGGANDLLTSTAKGDVIDAGLNQGLNIQHLVDAGATQFLILNLPPLGLTPRLNQSPSASAAATKAAELFNQTLAGTISVIRDQNAKKHLNLVEIDVFTLFKQVVAAPSRYALKNVKASAQDARVDPDTWLFWDNLHPTTRGHNLLATTAARLLTQSQLASGPAPEEASTPDLTPSDFIPMD